MIRALLFDAAGTLIEPAEPVAEVYARHFRDHGWDAGPAPVRAAFGRVFATAPPPDYEGHADGDAAEHAWWREVVIGTMRSCGIDPAADEGRADSCFRALFSHYEAPSAWRVFAEVPLVLEAARREGFRLAVVSNFDRRLHRILEGSDLSFEFVLTSAAARARKPDPSIFRQALDRLGLLPGEVLHAGDSRGADVAGAQAAGIGPFLLERPHGDLRGFLAEAIARRGK